MDRTNTIYYLSFLVAMIFLLCSYQQETSIEEKLIGIWLFKNADSTVAVYSKKIFFKDDEPGIEFKKEGKLIVRQNISWCGTPPITYGNYDGSWNLTPDSIINVKFKFWGGETEEQLKLFSVQSNTLKIKLIKFQKTKN